MRCLLRPSLATARHGAPGSARTPTASKDATDQAKRADFGRERGRSADLAARYTQVQNADLVRVLVTAFSARDSARVSARTILGGMALFEGGEAGERKYSGTRFRGRLQPAGKVSLRISVGRLSRTAYTINCWRAVQESTVCFIMRKGVVTFFEAVSTFAFELPPTRFLPVLERAFGE